MKGPVLSSSEVPKFNVKTPEFGKKIFFFYKKRLKKAERHIGRNVEYTAINKKTIVRIP